MDCRSTCLLRGSKPVSVANSITIRSQRQSSVRSRAALLVIQASKDFRLSKMTQQQYVSSVDPSPPHAAPAVVPVFVGSMALVGASLLLFRKSAG